MSLGGGGGGDYYDDDEDDDDVDVDVDVDDDLDLDDGSYADDQELRRKLNRLAGPGGAMEAESREAPHLFGPGGALESPEMARAVGGPAASGGKSFFFAGWVVGLCKVVSVFSKSVLNRLSVPAILLCSGTFVANWRWLWRRRWC